MPTLAAPPDVRTRRAYPLRMSRRAPNLVVAVILGAVGISVVGPGIDAVGVTLVALLVAAGAGLALWALRSRLVLDGDRLEVRSTLRTRTLRRDDIDGVQRIVNRYGRSTRVFLKNDRGVVTVSGDFTGNDDLERWLAGLPDVDERNAALIERTIDSQAGAAPGSQVHQAVLDTAGSWAAWLSAAVIIAGVATTLPYRRIAALGLVALMVFPPLAVALLHRFPLRFTIFKARVDPRADLMLLVIVPAFGILLPNLFGGGPWHLVDYTALTRVYVPIALAFVAALGGVAWKSPARWGGLCLVLLSAIGYSVGLVAAVDTIADESQPTFFRTWVVRKHVVQHRRSTDLDLRVAPWGPITYPEDIAVSTATYDRTAVGDPVCMALRNGRLHAPWYAMVPCAGPVVRDAVLSVPETADQAGALLAEAQRGAARKPNDAHAQFVLGQCLVQLKRYDEALPPLLAAERLDSTDTWTHNSIGWVLNQQRRYDMAIPHLRAAVALDSTYAYAQRNLGWAYLEVNDLPDAERTYRTVVRLQPNDARAAREHALALERLQGARAAEGEMARALQLDSADGIIQADAGFLFRSEARFPEARRHYEAASRLLPNSASVWGELAATDYLMNDRAAAAAAFTNSVRLDSSYVRRRPDLLEMWREAAPGDAR